MKRAWAVLVLGVAVGLTGCGGGDDSAGGSPPATTAPATTAQAPATTAQTPAQTPTTPTGTVSTPAPTTTPTKPKPPLAGRPMTAKDGRKTSRCLKKSCEVLVSTGNQFRLSTRTGLSTVVIEAVDAAAGVSIGVYGDSGFQAPAVTSGANPGPTSIMTYNGVSFTPVAISGKTMVLRLKR